MVCMWVCVVIFTSETEMNETAGVKWMNEWILLFYFWIFFFFFFLRDVINIWYRDMHARTHTYVNFYLYTQNTEIITIFCLLLNSSTRHRSLKTKKNSMGFHVNQAHTNTPTIYSSLSFFWRKKNSIKQNCNQ